MTRSLSVTSVGAVQHELQRARTFLIRATAKMSCIILPRALLWIFTAGSGVVHWCLSFALEAHVSRKWVGNVWATRHRRRPLWEPSLVALLSSPQTHTRTPPIHLRPPSPTRTPHFTSMTTSSFCYTSCAAAVATSTVGCLQSVGPRTSPRRAETRFKQLCCLSEFGVWITFPCVSIHCGSVWKSGLSSTGWSAQVVVYYKCGRSPCR